MKRKVIKRKKKREMLKDFLKKNVQDWKQRTKRGPMPQSSRRTTA
ncbi:hypothetical protein [Halalkalibacter alkalisediminis]|nr:hypothetical protein [Halalkalibacter alkalisediminis]